MKSHILKTLYSSYISLTSATIHIFPFLRKENHHSQLPFFDKRYYHSYPLSFPFNGKGQLRASLSLKGGITIHTSPLSKGWDERTEFSFLDRREPLLTASFHKWEEVTCTFPLMERGDTTYSILPLEGREYYSKLPSLEGRGLRGG